MFIDFFLKPSSSSISDFFLYRCLGITIGGSIMFSAFIYLKILFTPLKPNIIPEKTPTEKYIEKYRSKFHNSYKDDKYNSNIQQEFYDKEKYNTIVESKDNYLEKSWKQRVLIENTPQGNIIMFFDAYKLAFSYYADAVIPYNILNIVAMKYVFTFFCRDFFLDKSIIPFRYSTPLLHVHEIEKDTQKKQNKIDVSKGPFAKFKNYTKEEKTTKEKQKKETDDESPPVKNYIKNKFIHLGKLYNFSILKNTYVNTTIKRKEIIPINYGSFKKWHQSAQFKMVTDKDYHDSSQEFNLVC